MGNKNDNYVKKVSIVGLVLNLFLLLIKFFAGIISKSQAMIADSLNSAGDIFASIMSYTGSKIASKPIDKDHPYGHGKAEYIFSFIIGILMIIASVSMINSSLKNIILNKEVNFSMGLILVCVITIITKFVLYLWCKDKYNKCKSILIKVSMEDHRNDMFLTLGTIISIIFCYFKIYFVDGIIGIGISIWIIYVGINILLESYKILMDTNISPKEQEEIIKRVELQDEVMHVDSIISKPIGNKYIIILKVSMDGKMTLNEAHKICGIIKEGIIGMFEYVQDVIVHPNPH